MNKNQIKIFENNQFGQIRTAGTSEEPLFCLKDICRVLELQVTPTKNRLNPKGVNLINPLTQGGEQQSQWNTDIDNRKGKRIPSQSNQ